MKAVVCTKYGSPEVLQIKDVAKPIPKSNELLVKISTVAVTTEDPLQRKGKPYFARIIIGFTKPKKSILGTEFAGEIEDIGNDVKLFKKGDRIFGSTGSNFGCYAEYVCIAEEALLSIKPQKITNEEVTPICSALTAWNFLKTRANIQSGQNILINGASGSVGSAAVQIAKVFGAEVTGVCSTKNLKMVKCLGVDKVIDYTNIDFTKNGQKYDIIFDVAGKSTFSQCKKSLKQKGIYLNPVLTFSILFQMFWTSIFNSKKVMFSATGLQPLSERQANLKELIELFASGKLKTIIEKSYKLEQIVDAHKHIESGLKRGNILINLV